MSSIVESLATSFRRPHGRASLVDIDTSFLVPDGRDFSLLGVAPALLRVELARVWQITWQAKPSPGRVLLMRLERPNSRRHTNSEATTNETAREIDSWEYAAEKKLLY